VQWSEFGRPLTEPGRQRERWICKRNISGRLSHERIKKEQKNKKGNEKNGENFKSDRGAEILATFRRYLLPPSSEEKMEIITLFILQDITGLSTKYTASVFKVEDDDYNKAYHISATDVSVGSGTTFFRVQNE
jgi:hypothetical protein